VRYPSIFPQILKTANSIVECCHGFDLKCLYRSFEAQQSDPQRLGIQSITCPACHVKVTHTPLRLPVQLFQGDVSERYAQLAQIIESDSTWSGGMEVTEMAPFFDEMQFVS